MADLVVAYAAHALGVEEALLPRLVLGKAPDFASPGLAPCRIAEDEHRPGRSRRDEANLALGLVEDDPAVLADPRQAIRRRRVVGDDRHDDGGHAKCERQGIAPLAPPAERKRQAEDQQIEHELRTVSDRSATKQTGRHTGCDRGPDIKPTRPVADPQRAQQQRKRRSLGRKEAQVRDEERRQRAEHSRNGRRRRREQNAREPPRQQRGDR